MDNERLKIVEKFNKLIGEKATEEYFQKYNVEFGCKPVDILESEDYNRLKVIISYLENGKF